MHMLVPQKTKNKESVEASNKTVIVWLFVLVLLPLYSVDSRKTVLNSK